VVRSIWEMRLKEQKMDMKVGVDTHFSDVIQEFSCNFEV
jgi:hypothetical protein